jgi:hypothetical protein
MVELDYIEKHGGVLEDQLYAGAVKLRLPADRFHGTGFYFRHLSSDRLRAIVNEAMDVAVGYYLGNVAKTAGAIETRCVEEASLSVVLHTVYVNSATNRNRLFDVKDLARVSAQDEILSYSKKRFEDAYALQAASLMGITLDEFLKWEIERREFEGMW